MKKVLHHVAVMDRGGQETFIMNVFRNINRELIDFDFLCTLDKNGAYDKEIYGLGGKIYHVPSGFNKIKIIDRSIGLYKFLVEHKGEYDVFHIHTQHAMDAYICAKIALFTGIKKVIVHSHSTSTVYHPKLHKLFRPLLNKLQIFRFACSDLAGEWLYGKNESFTVIKNGVDISRFSFSEKIRNIVRTDLKLENKHIVGHVGSFTYPKNHEFIIDIFSQLSMLDENAVLVLVGTGPGFDNIRLLVNERNIADKVLFLGSRSDVNYLDQAFDVFVFPSRYEGLPVVLVEAQCSGVPCLISDTITEEIDVTKQLFRENINNEPSLWANQILKLFNAKYCREEASEDVVRSGYDINNTVKELEKYYES